MGKWLNTEMGLVNLDQLSRICIKYDREEEMWQIVLYNDNYHKKNYLAYSNKHKDKTEQVYKGLRNLLNSGGSDKVYYIPDDKINN